ncbi:MAG: hypothetical protein A2431_02670 [Candidatus Zambryskibacteria bacterium RIFOXYC1_FULL_39_10]|uniref:Uncharacterized protein n=1 Tax=Candidatus Zambryskibacteria bacterium RIFOXYC1_FULL_39_10 TaxID=1802779 RepID=A0A1G2UXX4_9BACT|nr:MAG: hypothetical protein A2431_02670 [Candidatus Zambryskibacteria bacterium RIFOXYC1_FULL_39_10]OHB14783.1 MAG: hypothetical protein A2605_03970 [Candidatus Zambryskibacteria bacterium RIFOXYD1_FULL_39_35]
MISTNLLSAFEDLCNYVQSASKLAPTNAVRARWARHYKTLKEVQRVLSEIKVLAERTKDSDLLEILNKER